MVDKKTNRLVKKTEDLAGRVHEIEEELQRKRNEPPPSQQDKPSEYTIARRSIRLSPCGTDQDEVMDFLEKRLKLPNSLIEPIDVICCKEVFKKPVPLHRQNKGQDQDKKRSR